MNEIPLFLTAPEAADLLRVKVDRLRRWIERGELVAANLGDKSRPRYRIARPDLLAFLERRSAKREPVKVVRTRTREPALQGPY